MRVAAHRVAGAQPDRIEGVGVGVEESMTTAIIGVGNLGSALARRLVHGGEDVVLAGREGAHSEALAHELGPLARSASVSKAIEESDTVVVAVWLAAARELLSVAD